MPRPLRVLLILTILSPLALSPAVATQVNVKYAAADYDSWSTWSFVETASQNQALDNADRAALGATIRSAIAKRLTAAGFTPAAEGQQADFQVAIDGTMREVFDVHTYHKQIADHVAFVLDGGASSYHEGTLMIRILDGETAVWTGWITDAVKDPDHPEKQIRKAVKKILRRFPPKDR